MAMASFLLLVICGMVLVGRFVLHLIFPQMRREYQERQAKKTHMIGQVLGTGIGLFMRGRGGKWW